MASAHWECRTQCADDSASAEQLNILAVFLEVPMLRIYLVEDNPIIRQNLIETLTELVGAMSVGSSETESAAKAWLAVNGEEWDLAIVDIFLKQGSGMRVLSTLRERNESQKVVVLSHYASPEARTECLRLGVDEVFDKTNEIEPLIEFCKNLKST